MWYVMTAGTECTLLCTPYRNIARMCAILLPGRNIARFVPDNWNKSDSKDFAFPTENAESA